MSVLWILQVLLRFDRMLGVLELFNSIPLDCLGSEVAPVVQTLVQLSPLSAGPVEKNNMIWEYFQIVTSPFHLPKI